MTLKFASKAFLLAFIMNLGILYSAHADTAVSDDTQNQIVSQSENLRKEIQREKFKPTEKPEIVVDEKTETPPGEEGPEFLVKKINIEGSTLFKESDFSEYLKEYEGQKVSFGKLRKLVQLVTNHYRSRGYLTSRAYIPPQKMDNEIVTLKIIEGKVDKVLVEGNKYFSSQTYTNAMKLNKSNIFRYQDLESSLYEINQKPDRKAKAYLLAGKEITTSDILLKVEETNPFHAAYEYNNHGTSLTHHGRHVTHVTHNNLTNHGDIFDGTYTLASEGAFGGGAFNYSFPLESTGTTLGLSGSYVNSLIVKHLKPFEIKGDSKSLTPEITQSIIRKPATQFDWNLAFEMKDSKTLVNDVKVNFDRMRVLRTGPRLYLQDGSGRSIISSDFHWGIPDILGGSEARDSNASRLQTGGDFVSFSGYLARIHRLPQSTFLIARVGGQYSPDSLTSLEQYRLGGYSTVRGYSESDSSGDYGYNFSSEWHVPFTTAMPYMPKVFKESTIPFTDKNWFSSTRFVLFLDGGKSYLQDRATSTTVKDKFLLGTGFGVRMELDKTFSLQCDLGFAIGDDPTAHSDHQLHLSVKAGF